MSVGAAFATGTRVVTGEFTRPLKVSGRVASVFVYFTMRTSRSMPSWTCSRPSWVFMKHASM